MSESPRGGGRLFLPGSVSLPVTAIWSRVIDGNVETWVEVGGEWYRCIVESGDNFSWIAECRGLKCWPKMVDGVAAVPDEGEG